MPTKKPTKPQEVQTIEVFGRSYNLEYYSKGDFGCFMPYGKIQIKNDKMKDSTTLHEVIHAILYESGHSVKLDEKDEEAMVLALEHGLSHIYELRLKKQGDHDGSKASPSNPNN